MKSLNIEASEIELAKYGIDKSNISFHSLVEKIKNVLAKEALQKAQQLAKKSGLSDMSDDDIINEIKAIRHDKRNS